MPARPLPRNPRGGVYWWVCSVRDQACCLTHYPADSGSAAENLRTFVCPIDEIDPGFVIPARKTAWRQDKGTVTGKAARESAGMGAGYSIPDPGQGGKPVPDDDVPTRIVVTRGQYRSAMVGRTVQAGLGRCWTAEVWYKAVAQVVVTTRGCLGREQDGKVGELVELGIAVGRREIAVPQVRGSPRRNAGDVAETRRTRPGSLDVESQVRWVVRWEGRLVCPSQRRCARHGPFCDASRQGRQR